MKQIKIPDREALENLLLDMLKTMERAHENVSIGDPVEAENLLDLGISRLRKELDIEEPEEETLLDRFNRLFGRLDGESFWTEECAHTFMEVRSKLEEGKV